MLTKLRQGLQVTLVLGAGVSRSRGLPLWPDLMRSAWKAVMAQDPYAWDTELLGQCKAACVANGLPREFIDRLDVRRHPLELQLAFEGVFAKLRSDLNALQKELNLPRKLVLKTAGLASERRAAYLFADLLRKILYGEKSAAVPKWDPEATDTLSLVAGAILHDLRRVGAERKIARVITFNVDDLLERVVNYGRRDENPRVYPVRWSSDTHRPPGKQAMGIYHLHGFVPMNPGLYPFFSRDEGKMDVPLPLESLVFTDQQYWQAVGSSGDFASRVFAQALGGTCLFLGVSMTDINLMRWLALHGSEVKRDIQAMTADWKDSSQATWAEVTQLSGHYWITVADPDPVTGKTGDFGTDMLRKVLSDGRGVQCINLQSWKSKRFHRWWKTRFYS